MCGEISWIKGLFQRWNVDPRLPRLGYFHGLKMLLPWLGYSWDIASILKFPRRGLITVHPIHYRNFLAVSRTLWCISGFIFILIKVFYSDKILRKLLPRKGSFLASCIARLWNRLVRPSVSEWVDKSVKSSLLPLRMALQISIKTFYWKFPPSRLW